jgi:hypothetical protein
MCDAQKNKMGRICECTGDDARVQATFTPDEVYAHLRSFEEIIKQTGELMHDSKALVFSA